eukprot:5019075-Pleurochrysis_carterae.AAC.1
MWRGTRSPSRQRPSRVVTIRPSGLADAGASCASCANFSGRAHADDECADSCPHHRRGRCHRHCPRFAF